MAIVSIQVGNCGNKVGTRFWEEIAQEHGISDKGERLKESDIYYERIGVHYHETAGKYTPRNILVDLDPDSLDSIRSSAYGQLFNPANFISGQGGTDRNFGKGRYSSEEVIDSLMEVVRQEVETCDRLGGFQLTHSIGGGTGSGVSSRLMMKMREEYCGDVLSTYSILPSTQVGSVELETYNSVLAFPNLIELCDMVTLIDNEALYASSLRSTPTPEVGFINGLMGHLMNGLTASLRYPSQLNSTLRSTLTNMVPFLRLHFFTPSFVSTKAHGASVVSELTSKVFDHAYSAVNTPFKSENLEYTYAVTATFRGEVNATEAYEHSLRHAQSNFNLPDWIPDSVMTEVLSVPQRGFKNSVAMLANLATVQSLFTGVSTEFSRLYENRTHLNLYTSEGMDEMEFAEAESNFNDLISELTPCLHGAYEDYEDFDEEQD
jgi:tubulin beta